MNFRKYIITSMYISVLVKCFAIFIQLYFIPVAASNMGSDEFALFGLSLAFINWITLANLGISSQIIAELKTKGKQKTIIEYYLSTALSISTILFFIAIIILSSYVFLSSEKYLKVLAIAFFVVALNLVSAPLEGDLNFRQKLNTINVLSLIGSIISIIVLFFITTYSSEKLLLALFLPQNLLKALVTVYSYLIKQRLKIKINISLRKLIDNLKFDFFIMEQLNNLVSHFYPIILLTIISESIEVTKYTFLVTLIGLLMFPFSLILRPLKGIISNRDAYDTVIEVDKIKRYFLIARVLFFIIWIVFGNFFMNSWLGEFNPFYNLEVILIGFYFVMQNIENIIINTDGYFGHSKRISKLVQIQLFAVIIFLPIVSNTFTGMIIFITLMKFMTVCFYKVRKLI